ncbi:dienelactone hydrolase [Saccharothrix tamanrassetensis]|uniref:Dienelactone hydrolase n=1 Tax=Saccharothrix tamanrassetensis TaxID=1051531 RepID=A0A841CNU9_9PSEU|nr:dienelactone hydrolase family protein [Saccharothrix tamanrassetensis]MBB5960132.1 dienelactone hydrolase [Saccharothrix tamanrassetensis]
MSTALVVAHEIFGPDKHIQRMAEAVRHPEWTVSTPNFLPGNEVFPLEQEERAYRRFTGELGVVAMAEALAEHAAGLRTDHHRVLCLGFSVGATAAWLAAAAFDSIVCVYGSRIRDYTGHRPRCPCLLVFAEQEPGSTPGEVVGGLAGPTVAVELYEARHGFCNEDSPHHHAVHSASVVRSARRFFHSG